jgi:hypothetical protein
MLISYKLLDRKLQIRCTTITLDFQAVSSQRLIKEQQVIDPTKVIETAVTRDATSE